MFDVLVSAQVNAERDSTTTATFIHLVLDEEESNDSDIFPVMWGYFCHADTGTVYDGIESRSHASEPFNTRARNDAHLGSGAWGAGVRLD